jgi:hypothetical protein
VRWRSGVVRAGRRCGCTSRPASCPQPRALKRATACTAPKPWTSWPCAAGAAARLHTGGDQGDRLRSTDQGVYRARDLRSGTAEAGGPRSPACRSRRCPQAARRGAPRLAVAVRNGGCVPPRRAGRRPESSIRPRRNPFKEEAMIRAIAWTLTVLAVIAAYAAIGPTPIAAACPPTPECPCP